METIRPIRGERYRSHVRQTRPDRTIERRVNRRFRRGISVNCRRASNETIVDRRRHRSETSRPATFDEADFRDRRCADDRETPTVRCFRIFFFTIVATLKKKKRERERRRSGASF